MSQKFSNVADFAIIYIEEAHAEDEWKFNVSCSYSKILVLSDVLEVELESSVRANRTFLLSIGRQSEQHLN